MQRTKLLTFFNSTKAVLFMLNYCVMYEGFLRYITYCRWKWNKPKYL